MTRNLRAVLFGFFGGVTLLGAFAVACSSNSSLPGACNDLVNCCSSASFPGDPSSCIETAQSGELAEATCAQELTMYQQSGQCAFDAGPDGSGGDDAGGDDAGDDAGSDAARD